MIFPYRTVITDVLEDDEFVVTLRPEIPICIPGPSGSGRYVGLVDTGSDQTILPKSIADDLGIPLRESLMQPAVTFSGQQVRLLTGETALVLESAGEVLKWKSEVSFFDFPPQNEETLILGHASFLDFFTATFDGQQCQLTLVPNSDIPTFM